VSVAKSSFGSPKYTGMYFIFGGKWIVWMRGAIRLCPVMSCGISVFESLAAGTKYLVSW
jgi:hypothetical protein